MRKDRMGQTGMRTLITCRRGKRTDQRKWLPTDAFLYEYENGQIMRCTSLVVKLELLKFPTENRTEIKARIFFKENIKHKTFHFLLQLKTLSSK